ncbi:MAG: Stp1/IreP family PP2C-type Ser/Thr phosphatase [Clostridia bacterium]|nr:Stp1/IreP family PP2C-type Ser/Thr phosphatase [Clostridia bacterium]
MILAAKTDVGVQRENNQDSYSFGELLPGVCYAIVCDGMGGAAEGAVASRECVRIMRERIQNGFYDGMSDRSVRALMTSSVDLANKQIFNLSLKDQKYEGMGTTVVAAIITQDYVYVVHAGDSRAYLINPAKRDIVQLTRDHSVVQKMVEDGTITAEQAADHPKKHLITRAVGVDSSVRADFCQENIYPGDIILLCTDGLTNYSSVSQLVLFSEGVSLDEYVSKLVENSIENGGGDNVTVVAVSV